MKEVSETKAGKSISAFIILNPKGNLCAKVHAHFSDSGTCTVDIWEMGKGTTHQGKAGGYGYDKFTAALRGGKIEGHKIYDHSVSSEESNQILEDYTCNKLTLEEARKQVDKIGASFANWTREGKYKSLYMEAGLDRLNSLGYKVIQAI